MMPGLDGTGPRGMGPMTGGGRGLCAMPYTGFRGTMQVPDSRYAPSRGAVTKPPAPLASGMWGARGGGRGWRGGRGRGGAGGGRGRASAW